MRSVIDGIAAVTVAFFHFNTSSNRSKMKLTALGAMCILCVLHTTRAYDQKYDSVDVEGILAHELVHQTVNGCLLDVIDCGEFWREVKVIAREIATTHCAKCTPRQKYIIKTYSVATKKKYPEVWKQLRQMYKNS